GWDVDWHERARQAGTNANEMRRKLEGICSGFRPGSSALAPETRSAHNVADVPPLGDVNDPWSWHELGDHPAVAMRRARRIDVWRDDGQIAIDAMFRDSCWTPDGTEVAVHEYRINATVDPNTMTVASLVAEPRVLPYRECPGAARNAARMGGVGVGDLRSEVL